MTDTRGNIYEEVRFPSDGKKEPQRPYVAINMVSSLDGRIAVDGKSFQIGSEADRGAMRRLRAKADAVAIGAGTLRAEKLALGLDATTEGRDAGQPLAVVLTTGGDIPLENLVRAPDQGLLVFVSDAAEGGTLRSLRERGASIERVRRTAGGLDLAEILRTLSVDHDVRVLLVEGGPALNRALISAGLVDELFLTLAPKLLGGSREPCTPTTMLRGAPLERQTPLKLLSVQAAGDELFLRYALRTEQTEDHRSGDP